MKAQRHKGTKAQSFPHAARGFSLVEVSLALLIIGVAMLSILGMFPAGLEQNTRSIADTHAALFAGEVFNFLRVHAEINWEGINNTMRISPAASNNWDNLADTLPDDKVHTNIYQYPGHPEIVDHALRYSMAITNNGLIKAVTLRVWPGEFGTTNNPTLFYSEFYRMSR